MLFFPNEREDIDEAQKYELIRDIAIFADRSGFTAVYFPERHFIQHGSSSANPAVLASYLIPQTSRIRFRTAGITLPLHHPAHIVETWATNDLLSGGRVDLGFGSGFTEQDFILAPQPFADRHDVCFERIPLVQRLWRGETVSFPGPDGKSFPVTVYPRPIQDEVAIWTMAGHKEEFFVRAGKGGYNVFTMMFGDGFEGLTGRIGAYRKAREEAGFDPQTGTVSLNLHTLVLEDEETVHRAVKKSFRFYIEATVRFTSEQKSARGEVTSAEEQRAEVEKVWEEYYVTRKYRHGGILGGLEDARSQVASAIEAGVNDIAFFVDFGADFDHVRASLPNLGVLVSEFTRGN
jgi:natural product biosynthesis luciferase-like monooxygenase protein